MFETKHLFRVHKSYKNVDIKRALARSIPSNGDDYVCYIKRKHNGTRPEEIQFVMKTK